MKINPRTAPLISITISILVCTKLFIANTKNTITIINNIYHTLIYLAPVSLNPNKLKNLFLPIQIITCKLSYIRERLNIDGLNRYLKLI